eukprot:4677554-Pleurochrysis_carterae.AAC.1
MPREWLTSRTWAGGGLVAAGGGPVSASTEGVIGGKSMSGLEGAQLSWWLRVVHPLVGEGGRV